MTAPTLTPRAALEQETFRQLLDAMARPGEVRHVPPNGSGRLAGGATSVLIALLDHEVTFASVPGLADVTESVLRLTGTRLATASEADYVFCLEAGLEEALRLAKTGEPDYPDRSATIVCQLTRVGEGDAISLDGPGIDGSRELRLHTFPQAARRTFALRNADRPLGVDLIFVDTEGRIACLSRYTNLKEA